MVSSLPDGVDPSGFKLINPQGIERPTDEIETQDADGLFDNILTIGQKSGWTEEQLTSVAMAYDLACYLHEGDIHRDKPYIYHLLRNANRILKRLHLKNPDLIIATLLHDSVEDHADLILEGEPDIAPGKVSKRTQALNLMQEVMPEDSTRILRGMTNPILPEGKGREAKARKLSAYIEHVTEAVEDSDVWVCKFVDWVDNGVGIVNAEKETKSVKLEYRKNKYSQLQAVLEARYYRRDIQEMLCPEAKQYIEEMFALGRERLSGAKRVAKIGEKALDDVVDPPEA